MSEFRYKGFISYSWADAAWGKWLHHAIETYRTPGPLIGKETPGGPVPARLMPLFKDREEEAAGTSIGKAVETALLASEFLIVVCSPRSAKSEWVNREIAWFKTHRDPEKILALIVDGNPGDPATECFPKALNHLVDAAGQITDQRIDAPLAADARTSGDGKRRARLKLAAAMLGVGLDELVRRDDRRRALRARLVTGGSLLLAAVMSGMAWFAVQQRNDARHQRSESDGLVEFMLTDLREKLEPVGRLDALDVVGQRALKYYAGQRPGDLDADALGRRSRALHLVGEVRNIRGDSVGGLAAFRTAAATTAESLARDPNNPHRIFDHAQSVFWVGYIAYERGEGKEAEAQFREYKRLADQLMALDPKKPEWQMESSYAESNLGTLLYDQGRFAEAEPAFAKALAMVERVAAQEKSASARQLEVGAAINWLGKAQAGQNRYTDAIALHHREIAIYQKILQTEPTNTKAKMLMAVAWQHVGQLEEVRGQATSANTAIGASLTIMQQLRVIEPGNSEWQETELRALIAQIENLHYQGKPAAARTLYSFAHTSLDRMTLADPKNTIWSVGLRSSLEIGGARLALTAGNAAEALALARGITKRLTASNITNGAETVRIAVEAAILAGDALARLGRLPEAQAVWRAELAKLAARSTDYLSMTTRSRYRLLKRLGQTADARRIAIELDRQGYRHPAYRLEK